MLAAHRLGYDAMGVADANSMAGVVRIHGEAQTLGLRPVIGCRIETTEGLTFLAYPANRTAYGQLCALISAGRMARLDGTWQAKGVCEIDLALLAAHAEGVHLVLLAPRHLDQVFTIEVESNVVPLAGGVRGRPEPDAAPDQLTPDPFRMREGREVSLPFPALVPHLVHSLPSLRHLAASYLYSGDDVARIKDSALTPKDVPIYGYVYDVRTGRLIPVA